MTLRCCRQADERSESTDGSSSGLPVILKERDRHNELDGHGTDNTYVYGLDLISVTDRTGAQSYFLYDGLGSTGNMTDGSGKTTATYSYDVFGAIRSESGSGAAANEWRFTGEQRDRQGNRNFYYLRARYYDPAIGRFLSQDPLPMGNLYAYVGNNPVNYIDPTGLHCKGWHPHHCVQDAVEEVAEPVVEALDTGYVDVQGSISFIIPVGPVPVPSRLRAESSSACTRVRTPISVVDLGAPLDSVLV